MSYYIHQTPGRLRVRTPALRGDAAATLAARAIFEGRPGITSVATNAATGSITVAFDACTVSPATLINALAMRGYLVGVIGFPVPLPARRALVSARPVLPALPPLPPGTARRWLGIAAKLILPVLAERAFGRTGKIIASALL